MKRRYVTKYLVVHTSASPDRWTVGDIRRLHVDENGWSDIGYHYVIERDGTLRSGRDEWRVGAHVQGINNCSVGICCIGHGDKADFSDAQKRTLYDLLIKLMERYKLSPMAIIGHREVNKLVSLKRINSQYRTDKSCPGDLVNMTDIRRGVVQLWSKL